MALNFSLNDSVSSTGLGLGNGMIDSRFFLSSIDSNLGLISHRVHVHSVINYVSLPAFPISEVTNVCRFLSSASTMGLVFASSSGLESNHGIFSTRSNFDRFMNMDLLRSMNSSMNQIDVRSDVERETMGLGLEYDGRTYSLPGYPPGVYRSPKCFATYYSLQMFAAHVQSAHYPGEGEEERRGRMAVRCRRRMNLCLGRSSHGLTTVPMSSMGITKGYAASRRKNGFVVEVDNVHRVPNGLGTAAAMRGPLHSVVIKG